MDIGGQLARRVGIEHTGHRGRTNILHAKLHGSVVQEEERRTAVPNPVMSAVLSLGYRYLATGTATLRSAMWRRYASRSVSSRSLSVLASNGGIRAPGQRRNACGSRMSRRNASARKYSVGLYGTFKSGPIVASPPRFMV